MTVEPALAAAAQAAVARIISRVAAEHLVDPKALAGKHPARQKAHVVMARCHAAHELRETGMGWKRIATALGMKGHPLAIRSARRWQEVNGASAPSTSKDQSQ
jgi:hypothetical protein